MKKIAYVGFGEIGKQISLFIREKYGEGVKEIFFDDTLFQNGAKNSFALNEYKNPEYENFDFYIGLGYYYLELKEKIVKDLIKLKRNLPNFIHYTSYIHPDVKIDDGVIIYPGCIIDKNVIVAKGVLLNNAVTISHDCEINECCYLSPSVTLSGFVSIEKCCFIGTGTLISNNIKIGKNVICGIGSVVTKNIPDKINCIGNPLKIVKKLKI